MDLRGVEKNRAPEVKLKRILLINRSFWPDVEATGQFFSELCQELARHYKVTVLAGRSYYQKSDSFKRCAFWRKEKHNDINIIRIRHTRFPKVNLVGRLINWTTYAALSFLAALWTREDMIVIGTDPPFLGIGAMVAGRLKSVPYLYNCRDLYPDVAFALGRLRKNSLRGRIFDLLNIKALGSARLVVCLGKSMLKRLKAKGIPDEKMVVIPDWVDVERIKPVPKEENHFIDKFSLRNKFVIMYSGNIGLAQDFSGILDALSSLKEDYALVFIGEGAGRKTLQEQTSALRLKSVLFLPYQPIEKLAYSLGLADLHLVPLKKGMAGAIVPSKVYGIMACAKPFLAITDRESEAAILAEEFGCGLWAACGDKNIIAEKINWAMHHPDELAQMGIRGRSLAEREFAKHIVINEWLEVLDGLLST